MNVHDDPDFYLALAADRLNEIGRPASDLVLLKHLQKKNALSRDQLRRCLKLAREGGDPRTAHTALMQLLSRLEADPKPTPALQRERTSLLGDEIYGLSLLDKLPATSVNPVTPVPGRLLYLLHHSRPYLTNGYATRGHGLAKGMTNAGIDLVCLTRPGFPLDVVKGLDTPVPERNLIEGVEYLHQLEPRRNGANRSRTYLIDATDQIEARLRKTRPQAVMVASNYVAALPALLASRRCGLPIVYEVRGFWEITHISRDATVEASFQYRLQVELESRTAAACDHVFTLATPMAEELVRRGVSRERISLLPNSCNPEHFQPRPRDAELAKEWGIPGGVPVIGYIGSFVQYEGLDDLVRACGRLKAQGLTFRLVLVGGKAGPLEAELEEIARQNGLSDWLITPGRVPHEAVDAWYSLIDIAPFPRKPQPVTEMVTPLKPLEAMAMHKAVVMSSVRAMAEMVRHGETGMVFEKGNSADLAACLSQLVEQPEMRRRLGENARRYVETERTWSGMGARVRDWLSNMKTEV